MLRKPATLGSFIFSVLLSTQATAGDLRVNVSGLSETTGKVYLTLCDSPLCFDDPEHGDASFYALVILKAESNPLVFNLTNLPQGDYAIFVFHDANSNGDFDTSLLGSPKEAFGYSNQLPVEADASFHRAKFSVPETGSVVQPIELALP